MSVILLLGDLVQAQSPWSQKIPWNGSPSDCQDITEVLGYDPYLMTLLQKQPGPFLLAEYEFFHQRKSEAN